MYQSSCGICTNVHLHRTPPVLSPLIPIRPSWLSKANTRGKKKREKEEKRKPTELTKSNLLGTMRYSHRVICLLST